MVGLCRQPHEELRDGLAHRPRGELAGRSVEDVLDLVLVLVADSWVTQRRCRGGSCQMVTLLNTESKGQAERGSESCPNDC